LLTVASVPNQGLRFAGAHLTWPGDVAETGLFIDSATNHLAFHAGGDAVNVFTDMLASIGSWDNLYAVDKTLDIDTSALIWTQTSLAGAAFRLERNLAAAATNMEIFYVYNQHSGDDQASIYIYGAATAGISKSTAKFVAESVGITAAEVLIGVNSAVVEAAADAAGSELISFYADVGGVLGLGTKVGFDATDEFTWGVRSASPGLFEVNTDTSALPVGLVVSDVGSGASVPFIVMEGPVSAPVGMRFVIARNGQTTVDADNATWALKVEQDSTGNILELHGAGVYCVTNSSGLVEHTPASPTAA
jgi:hypothetical protein